MPVMDGPTAARQIRRREHERGLPRVPIIAVTANAFAEDREICAQAGMDAHLSKPFTPQQLLAAIAACIPEATAAGLPAMPAAGPGETTAPDRFDAVVDLGQLAALRLAQPKLLDRLLRTYLEHAPKAIGELSDAMARSDAIRLAMVAHSLKSSSGNVGAEILAAQCSRLEIVARAGDVGGCRGLVGDIVGQFVEVRRLLEAELLAPAERVRA